MYIYIYIYIYINTYISYYIILYYIYRGLVKRPILTNSLEQTVIWLPGASQDFPRSLELIPGIRINETILSVRTRSRCLNMS